jgi:hypothetical protein
MGWSKSFHPQGFLNSLARETASYYNALGFCLFFRNQISSSFSDGAVDPIKLNFCSVSAISFGCAVTSSRSLNFPDS